MIPNIIAYLSSRVGFVIIFCRYSIFLLLISFFFYSFMHNSRIMVNESLKISRQRFIRIFIFLFFVLLFFVLYFIILRVIFNLKYETYDLYKHIEILIC